MADVADAETMELIRQQMGIQQQQTPSRILVKFSIVAEQDMEESEKQGRPVYKDREYITKWVPGDKDNVVHRPIRPLLDIAEFPDQYKAFKANAEQLQTGTPLEMLPFMSKAQIAELAHYGVRTAEQLAGMADVNGQKVMGFQQLKQKTQAYLDALAGAAPAHQMQAELGKRDEEISMLKKIIEEQGKKIEEVSRRK